MPRNTSPAASILLRSAEDRPSALRDFSSLVHIAHWRAAQLADQVAFTFLRDGEDLEENVTFAQLHRIALQVAGHLRQVADSGERVLILQEPGINYIVSLYGCLYAGLIAVPVYPPELLRLQATLPRLQAITMDAGATVVLSSQELIDGGVGERWAAGGSSILSIDAIRKSSKRVDCPPADEVGCGSNVAILQYTSGSTGTPRGVAITHDNLLANLLAAYDMWDVPDAVMVHWLPPYHDMGLIGGVFLPAYGGRRVVLMSPQSFLQRPFRLLQAFHRYRGTTTGTPNFGFELCVRKIATSECEGLDLSSWQIAVVGAEPVRAATLKRFVEKFSPYGFSARTICPAYGMAESTVLISGKTKHTAPLYANFDAKALQRNRVVAVDSQNVTDNCVTLVGCGPVIPTTEIRIVNPEKRTLAASDEVGEIWVTGLSIASGYWNQRDISRQVFEANLANEPGKTFLRTGDLGFQFQDQLFVNGRLKELVIIAGKNHYPHDIEKAVQSTHDAFRADHGAAFSIDFENEERLVLIQEITRPKKWDIHSLLDVAKQAVLEHCGIVPHEVVLVASGSLPKTSSGKLRRRECKDLYLQNQLRVLEQTSSKESVVSDGRSFAIPSTPTEIAVAKIWQEVLDLPTVYQQDHFFKLGGHSLTVTSMLHQVNRHFGCDLPIAFPFQNPTLVQFCSSLDRALGSPELTARQSLPPMTKSSPAARYPLSHAQKRFWLLDQLGQSGAFSQVPLTLRLRGTVDPQRVQQSIDRLLQCHRILLAQFVQTAGEVLQEFAEDAAVTLQTFDVRSLGPAEQFESVASIKSDLMQPFDLRNAPLMRAALIRTGEDDTQLLLVLHHIVCDGWSIQILLEDLKVGYRDVTAASSSGNGLEYVDFAVWERSEEVQNRIQKRLPYWQERLAGVPTLLDLPLDRPRTSHQRAASASIVQCLPRPLKEKIDRLADRLHATPFVVHLSAWSCVLSKYAKAQDFVLGVPTANRIVPEIEGVVGCFINTIPLRVSLDPCESTSDFLSRMRDQIRADVDASEVPFDRLLELLTVARQRDRLPLVQHLFLFQPAISERFDFGDAHAVGLESDYSSLFDFDLSMVIENRQQVEARLVYPPALFDAETMERMLASYVRVLEQMVEATTSVVGEVEIVTESQRESLLQWGNGPKQSVPMVGNTATLVEFQSAKKPDAVALNDHFGSMTYFELNAAANRLAHWLRSKGIQPHDTVGICVARGRQILISILATWKVGAAYVPLDPLYPESRLRSMLEDSELKLVMTESAQASLFEQSNVGTCLLDAFVHEIDSQPHTNFNERRAATEIAYLIYTSGSTGNPKGVLVPHGGVMNMLQSLAAQPGMTERDGLLALTTMSFDISVLELFLPLIVGGQVTIPENRVAEDPISIAEAVDRPEITIVQGTPSTFRMLLSTGWNPKDRLKIFCGGEPMPPDLVTQLRVNGADLWNVYGPTETTVWSTIHHVTGDDDSISIGKPIANTQVCIVDDNQRLLPAGVPGELLIGGFGVASGYHRRPELTAEKFVTCSHSLENISPTFYRTGDLVRWRNDASLEFLSRVDRQVKLRGHRIELGEIESALQRHDQIVESAVVKVGEAESANLVGYYAVQGGMPLEPQVVGKFLRTHLPEVMVPQHLVQCDTIPHTPAGKIDYLALPAVQLQMPAQERVEARTELELELFQIWTAVLQNDHFGVLDNFFEVGGDSLKAGQIFIRIRDQLSIELPLKTVYNAPTIAQLAEALTAYRLETADTDELERLLQELEQSPESDR